MEVLDAEAHEPALHGETALAEVAIRLGGQLGAGLRVGQAREYLPRRLVARLPDHLRELLVQAALDAEPALLLPAVGRHQVDELDHARRIDRGRPVVVGQAGRLAVREIDERHAHLGLAQPGVMGEEAGHCAVEEFFELHGRPDRGEPFRRRRLAGLGNAGEEKHRQQPEAHPVPVMHPGDSPSCRCELLLRAFRPGLNREVNYQKIFATSAISRFWLVSSCRYQPKRELVTFRPLASRAANQGWLNAFRNSTRNWKVNASVNRVFL
jgi:hypothetical protein